MVCFGSDTKARLSLKTARRHSQVPTFPLRMMIVLKRLSRFALGIACSLNYPNFFVFLWYPSPASENYARQDTAALWLGIATYRLIGWYVRVGWPEGGCQPLCVMAKFCFSFRSGSLPPVQALIFMQLAGLKLSLKYLLSPKFIWNSLTGSEAFGRGGWTKTWTENQHSRTFISLGSSLKKYKHLFSSVAGLTTHTNNREKRASSRLQNGNRENDSASLAPVWRKRRYIITLLEHQARPWHDIGTAASAGICIRRKHSFW